MIDASATIHPNAIVHPQALIGPNVTIGEGTQVHAFATVVCNTILGERNIIHSGAVIGGDPQDIGFDPAKTQTWVIIGNNNTFREGVTINRASAKADQKTVIGHHNYFMTNSHVGHDCIVGNHNIVTNCSALGGHIHMGNGANISAFCGLHQFINIGDYAFVAHASQCVKDILPFVMITGADKPRVCGLNTVGLKRAGFSQEDLAHIKQAYRIVFQSGLLLKDALIELAALAKECHHIQLWVDMIENSKRGFIR